MMHDPFQSYATLGAYSGVMNPLQLVTGGISPLGQQGIGGFGGIHPQQLQLATMLAHATNPQLLGQSGGFQNPMATIGQQNPVVQALQHQLVQQALQNPLVQQALQNPLVQQALQNPLVQQALQNQVVQQALQNPLVSQVLQNPLISQGLQNPLLNPIVSQYYQSQYPPIGIGGQSPFGQIGSPFGQTGSPFGQLAPQSWIGQQGFGGGSPFGYGHPLLSQWGGGRGIQGHGTTPWTGF